MNFRQNRRTMDRRIVHREHWNNLLVEIIDNGDTRSLFFGGDVLQSSMSLSHPNRLTLSYTHCMMASLLINDHPERVLVIGVGAGSLVRFLHSHLPTCRIDGIDNAPHIIKLAHGYFSLPEDERLTLFDRDGFDYLQQLPEPRGYDLILVDAFDGAGMAASIYHRACFDLCGAGSSVSISGAATGSKWTRCKTIVPAASDHHSPCRSRIAVMSSVLPAGKPI